MELKMKEKSYYSTIGLMGFREFLISEQSEKDTDRNTDREIDSVKQAIKDTQDKIHIIRMKRLLFRKKDELATLEKEPPPKYPFLPK